MRVKNLLGGFILDNNKEEQKTGVEEAAIKTPTELFNELKSKKNEATEEALRNFYLNALILAQKYKKTGQDRGATKLDFFIKNYEREKKLLGFGVNTYVYRSDIKYYIEHVASSDHVGIIELKYYPREIPDEIADEIEKFKKENLFDEYYSLLIIQKNLKKKLRKNVKRKLILFFWMF